MKRFDQINVIPFIDIMLVLLAIVLTTATFISQGKLDINLPKASHKTQTAAQIETIQLGIDNQLNLYYQQQKLSLADLKQKLMSLDKETAIKLKVDKSVPFQRFVELLELLKQQKLETFYHH